MKKYSTAKKIGYGTIAVIFFIFLVEAIASIAEYQIDGKYALATIGLFKGAEKTVHDQKVKKRNYEHEELVRKDSSQKTNQQISDENADANRLVYEPWLEYRNADFAGQFVNIKGLNRLTQPSIAGGTHRSDAVTIFFFGGSTMYGFNVADNETIPSFFTELYQQQFPNERPIKVFNYGIPYYYSYQELLLLTNLLYKGNQPSLVIFLDGLNDCLQANSSVNRQPYYTSAFEQLFLNNDKDTHFNDSSAIMYAPPASTDIPGFSEKIVVNLLENFSSIKKISSAFNTKPFFFIQPVPYYHYPNRAKDPICIKNDLPQFNYVYPALQQKSKEANDMFFLGDMLQNEKDYPFIDNIHYSPMMNKKIAQSIGDKVFDKIIHFSKN